MQLFTVDSVSGMAVLCGPTFAVIITSLHMEVLPGKSCPILHYTPTSWVNSSTFCNLTAMINVPGLLGVTLKKKKKKDTVYSFIYCVLLLFIRVGCIFMYIPELGQ